MWIRRFALIVVVLSAVFCAPVWAAGDVPTRETAFGQPPNAFPIAFVGRTEVVSMNTAGEPSSGTSSAGAISDDGRLVAFLSNSSDLVADGSNGCRHVYVRDRIAGTTRRVSVSSAGEQADSDSTATQISGNGRYVVFWSKATNLAPGDANGVDHHVFVHDLETGTTERLYVTRDGAQFDTPSFPSLLLASIISSDGRYVVFQSLDEVLLFDRVTGTSECVSVDDSGTPYALVGQAGGVTDDGRFVPFLCAPDSQSLWAMYLRDRVAGTTQVVSVDNAGQGLGVWCNDPVISRDGSAVVFWGFGYSWSLQSPTSFYGIYVRDLKRGMTQRVDTWSPEVEQTYQPSSAYASISSDGRVVAFRSQPLMTNAGPAFFISDRLTGIMTQVRLPDVGGGSAGPGYGYLSGSGRYFVFDEQSPWPGPTDRLNQVYLYDRQMFDDVPVDSWAYFAIDKCVTAGVVLPAEGAQSPYHPSQPVTRDVMAVFVSRAMAGGDAHIPTGPAIPSFADVPADNWAYNHVEYLKERDVVRGYGDGLYHPERVIDRGHMAIYIARALAGGDACIPREPPFPSYFDDITLTNNPEVRKYVDFLAARGVVAGYPDGLYHPEIVVTRDQMAVYVARVFGLQ